jgi:hypothetical protein
MSTIHIIGGGLAGCEAAWQAAALGVPVTVHEMRPARPTAVHKTDGLAELVCSNSFRGDKLDNAVGLLKEEMRRLGSLIMSAADMARVPAGAALAVDRVRFSEAVTREISSHPLITLVREEVPRIPDDLPGPLIVATGPLTSDSLSKDIAALVGGDHLYFYDAISPIVLAESIDRGIVFRASRWGRSLRAGDSHSGQSRVTVPGARKPAAFKQVNDLGVGRVELALGRQQIVGADGVPVATRTIVQAGDIERFNRAIDAREQPVAIAALARGCRHRDRAHLARERRMPAEEESGGQLGLSQATGDLAEAGSCEVQQRQPLEHLGLVHDGVERGDELLRRVELLVRKARILVELNRDALPCRRMFEEVREPHDAEQRQGEAGGEQRVDDAGG